MPGLIIEQRLFLWKSQDVPSKTRDDSFEVSWKLCVLISLLIHAAIVGASWWVPASVWNPQNLSQQQKGKKHLLVEIHPNVLEKAQKDQGNLVAQQDQEQTKPQFLKTSPEQETVEEVPQSTFIGERRTKASGGPKPPDDIKELPAQEGEENRDEIVLFDQERQDGVLEHEQKGSYSHSHHAVVQRVAPLQESQQQLLVPQNFSPSRSIPSQQMDIVSSPPSEASMLADPAFREQTGPAPNELHGMALRAAQGQERTRETEDEVTARDQRQAADNGKTGQADGVQQGESGDPTELALAETNSDRTTEPREDSIDNRADQDQSDSEEHNNSQRQDLLSSVMDNDRVTSLPRPARSDKSEHEKELGRQEDWAPQLAMQGNNKLSGTTANQEPSGAASQPKVYYDPAFSPDAQPGFRTAERKTKTTGRFSFGHNAALNVEATPTGMYMAMVYRAIAACWYRQCERNMDLIVPGTIHIRVWLDEDGRVTSIRELGREGASVVQKSFTFIAIQQASIPRMPPEVRKGLIGGKMELYFDFNF